VGQFAFEGAAPNISPICAHADSSCSAGVGSTNPSNLTVSISSLVFDNAVTSSLLRASFPAW
jgi:hypothetical protein